MYIIPEMPKIPELNKLRDVSGSVRSILEFLEWAEAEGLVRIQGGRPERIVYRFFNLNEQQIERERVALLDYQRALNAQGQAIP